MPLKLTVQIELDPEDDPAALLDLIRSLARRRPAAPPPADGPALEPLEPLAPAKQRREWPAAKVPAPAGARPDASANGHGRSAPAGFQGVPRTGKALYNWLKRMEAENGNGLVTWLERWAKEQAWNYKFSEWGPDQVELGYKEACRWLDAPNG